MRYVSKIHKQKQQTNQHLKWRLTNLELGMDLRLEQSQSMRQDLEFDAQDHQNQSIKQTNEWTNKQKTKHSIFRCRSRSDTLETCQGNGPCMFESGADSTRELELPTSWGNGGHSSLLPPHIPDMGEQKEQGPMETPQNWHAFEISCLRFFK